jgi:hypothetical protein
MRTRPALAAALLMIAAAACGGGGSTPAPPAATGSSGNTLGTARGTASIFIPTRVQTSGTARKAQWVSPSTQSISIQITRESDHYGTYYVAVTTPTAPNCAAVQGGTQCQIPFGAAPGLDDIVVYAWDRPDAGMGWQLASYARNAVNFTAAADNSMTFTLGGILGSLPPASAPTTFPSGTAADFSVALNPADIDHNAITGPLDAPMCVVLVNSGSAAHFTLTAPAAVGPGISTVPCVLPPNTGGPQPPTQAGIGILDPSKVGTVKVHYDGTPSASAQLTIGSQSIDTQQISGTYFITDSLAGGP